MKLLGIRLLGLALLLAPLAACQPGDITIGDMDGSTADSAVWVPCGATTCAVGDVCCNDSCGICTAPGGSCIELACTDAGSGGDAGSCVPCAAPPSGCRWDGGSCATCGTLVCPDGGVIRDSGTGEACGPVTCGPGTVCCNASCGICTPPGGACIALACSDAGRPDACTPPPCAAPPPGCRYVGAGCSSCGTLVCADGGPGTCGSNADCAPTDYCAGTGCGTPGACVVRPGACSRIYDPVCGCDGTTHGNPCSAAAAGVRVASLGVCPSSGCTTDRDCDNGDPCTIDTCVPGPSGAGVCHHAIPLIPPPGCGGGPTCGSVTCPSGTTCCNPSCGICVPPGGVCTAVVCTDAGVPPPLDCAPDDARGVGPCSAIVAVAWDGSSCVSLSGCSCAGADCGRYRTVAECNAAHAGCPTLPPPPPDCTVTGCPPGQSCQPCWGSNVCLPPGVVC